MKTNMENYEERFVDYMEGQLDAAEMQEVEAFVAQHPEFEDDFKLFAASKLVPDESIVFANKDSLMQKKTVVIPMFAKIMAAAATIALLIGIGMLFMNNSKPSHKLVANLSGLTPRSMTTIQIPQHTHQPKLKSSTLKPVPVSQPVKATTPTVVLAKCEVIPTLEAIKSSSIQWDHPSAEEYLDSRLDMGLEEYLATLSPVNDEESSDESYQYDSTPFFQKITRSIYKQTAKTVLAAYYTADCYISETKRSVGR